MLLSRPGMPPHTAVDKAVEYETRELELAPDRVSSLIRESFSRTKIYERIPTTLRLKSSLTSS